MLKTPSRSLHSSRSTLFAVSCFFPESRSCAQISTLVSTNVLPLMELVPAGSNHPAQRKTLFEKCHSLAFRSLVGFLLSYQVLYLLSEQAANGRASLDGNHPCFAERLFVETDCHVLFHQPPPLTQLVAPQDNPT